MRCEAHGLATGPDGRCVLCRRSSQGPVRAPNGPIGEPAQTDARDASRQPVPITAMQPRSNPGRVLAAIVGVSWLAASAGAVLWFLQEQGALQEFQGGSSQAAVPVGPMPGGPAEQGPVPPAGPRALTEDEAMRQVELAADRALQARLEQQRTRRQALERARQQSEAAQAVRDAERKAEIAQDMARQAQDAARRRAGVVMYTTSWCGACKVARRYFEQHGVAYDERDIEARAEWREQCRLLNPRLSVPTIRVGDGLMVGFSAERFEQLQERAAQRGTAGGGRSL